MNSLHRLYAQPRSIQGELEATVSFAHEFLFSNVNKFERKGDAGWRLDVEHRRRTLRSTSWKHFATRRIGSYPNRLDYGYPLASKLAVARRYRIAFSSIPFLVFSAHCLDLMDQIEERSITRPSGSQGDQHLKSQKRNVLKGSIITILMTLPGVMSPTTQAQQPASSKRRVEEKATTLSLGVEPRTDTKDVTERERLLLERVDQLERRLAEVESRLASRAETGTVGSSASDTASKSAPFTSNGAAVVTQTESTDRDSLDFVRDTTFNVTLDGYYGYNFNRPVGGINLLRAYDVTSNSFSLNQAALIIENAPNLEKGKRYGLRVDLQYGQATETVQGNAANEPRPQVYRPLWQAYGTYVADVGKGLTVDFGKFAGALGYETNYTKDNFNYSRSYYYNFLPFYHVGFRSTYAFNDKVTLTHWLVNGVQQAEDFNGFKSQALLLTWKPTPRITSQFNYYNGQEQRDRNPDLNPTFAPVASQPGLSIDVIRPVPSGRLHIFDTYHTFSVTDKLILAAEGDYIVGRVFRDSPPSIIWGGVGYARYQWTPKVALAGRFEYLSEKVSSAGSLFGGVPQALKEFTLTTEYKFADGFLVRAEYRRDFSNQPFFLTEQPGILKKEQNTATLGLVWWFGRKEGIW